MQGRPPCLLLTALLLALGSAIVAVVADPSAAASSSRPAAVTVTVVNAPGNAGAGAPEEIHASSQWDDLSIDVLPWSTVRWTENNAILPCRWCRKQFKGFLECVGSQAWPADDPLTWDPSACLAQWPGIRNCTNSEVGYSWVEGAPNPAAIAYAAFQGDCKDIVTYTVPLTRGSAPVKAPKPKASACNQCTAFATKALECALEKGTKINTFFDDFLSCLFDVSVAQTVEFLICGASLPLEVFSNTAQTDYYYVLAAVKTAGINPYLVCPTAEAWIKGGEPGLAASKRTVVTGKLGGGLGYFYN